MTTAACSESSSLTSVLLDSYLDENISAICPHGYHDPDHNHCAHFVCHVMNVATGTISCRGMVTTDAKGRIGVCIRVHELFAACPEVGLYDEMPAVKSTAGVFVFVTAKSAVNLTTKTMTNIPKKHVGIALNGNIWHYSNTKDKVVTASPESFRKHYSGQTSGLYYGTFPATATPSSFGCGR